LVCGAIQYRMKSAVGYPTSEDFEDAEYQGEASDVDAWETGSWDESRPRMGREGDGCHGVIGTFVGEEDWATWSDPIVCCASKAGHGIEGSGRGVVGGISHDGLLTAEISVPQLCLVSLGWHCAGPFSVETHHQAMG
jgi:hypothetical protein